MTEKKAETSAATSAAKGKELRPAGKIIIEISENDQIMDLIECNTLKTSKYKKPEVILKCLAMIAMGSKKKVACRTTGLPYQTYVKWIHKEWYHKCIELIKVEFDNQLDASLTMTTHKAVDALNDRIDNGDTTTDIDGNVLTRKPMSGRDLGVTFATTFDRRQLLRNKPTSVSESKSTKEHLDNIADRFEKMAVADAELKEVLLEKAKHDLAVSKGEYISIEDNQALYAHLGLLTKTHLEAMGGPIGIKGEGKSAKEITKIVDAAAAEILHQLSTLGN